MGSRMARSFTLWLFIAFSLCDFVLAFMNGNGAFWCTGRGRTETMSTERAMTSSSISTGTDFEMTTTSLQNNRLCGVFDRVKDTGRACFVSYIMAGHPKKEDTVDLLLGLQEGGTDVIELGVPFTDPQADGPIIQRAHVEALKNGVKVKDCFEYVKLARNRGLTTPVVLMGYINPCLAYGLDQFVGDAKTAGVDGFIIVDLPPEEAGGFVSVCRKQGLTYVPLVTPTTANDRLPLLRSMADVFVYCVSVTGITGVRANLAPGIHKFLDDLHTKVDLPIVAGFGISTPEQVAEIAGFTEGVVCGSAIVNMIEKENFDLSSPKKAEHLRDFVKNLKSGLSTTSKISHPKTVLQPTLSCNTDLKGLQYKNKDAYFGDYGGQFIPETLIEAHRELAKAYSEAKSDPEFIKELEWYRKEYIGGPTPMHFCKRLTEKVGGAQIWLKREELAFTGAHKINNAIGQALLAKRLGKNRIIAETGAGQHGVAAATVCALLGMDLTVYMGEVDTQRQELNVFRMELLGAKVVPVKSGSRTLKDAINEAIRDWVTNIKDTHYIIGSAIGSYPYPTIVRDFQSVIGKESREQILKQAGRLPDYVVACVGGGSNAIGIFHPFMKDAENGIVKFIGVEAGGKGEEAHSATITRGRPGVLHGTRTILLQDDDGQVQETCSISAGLDYPGVGPEHAWLNDSGRAEYVAITDTEALDGLQELACTEGIIAALESSHAVAHTMKLAKSLPKDKIIICNLSGRGDKDMSTIHSVLRRPK